MPWRHASPNSTLESADYEGSQHPPDLVMSWVDQRYTNPHIVPLTSDEDADV